MVVYRVDMLEQLQPAATDSKGALYIIMLELVIRITILIES